MSEPSKLVHLDQAKSGRSTCRATGDTIAKGEFRVGIEAYTGGHISMTWQKVVPFLHGCYLEYAKTGTGADKKTGIKIPKGDPRFVMTSKGAKIMLSFKSACEELTEVLENANKDEAAFAVTSFKGLDDMRQNDRDDFFNQFSVSAEDQEAFNKEHPAPVAPAEPEPAKKKQKTAKAAKKEDQDSEADGEAEEEVQEEEEEAAEHAETTTEQPKVNNKPVKVEEMSQYERERQEHIARNKERMMALQLPSLANHAVPQKEARPAKPKGITAKRQKTKEEPGPRRASLRQRGVKADGAAVDTETRGGHITVVNGEAIRYLEPAEPAEPRERHPDGPTEFHSLNGNSHGDEAFLQLLKAQTGPSLAGPGVPKGKTHPSYAQLARLQLQEPDVAKVTKNGIVHLAFHPCTDSLVLAAADKSGHIGLWSVDNEARPASASESKENQAQGAAQQDAEQPKSGKVDPQPGQEEEGDDDGVLELAPHYQYVSGLRWAGGVGGAAKLMTASYDGSVRCLDPVTASFDLLVTDSDAEFSALDCLADASSGFVGDNEGNLQGFDSRQKGPSQAALNIHDKKINTIHVEPVIEQLFATACSDNSVSVWDRRKLSKGGKPISTISHSLTCQSAFFAPDGSQRVLSTSRDDSLRVWDAKKELTQLSSFHHYNNTGRWVVPFRAVWGAASDTVICGSMKRTIDLLDTEGKLAQLSSDFQTAISSRHCVHPTVPVLAAGTASGRMYIYR